MGYYQVYDIQPDQLEVGFAVHPDFQGKDGDPGFGGRLRIQEAGQPPGRRGLR